MSSSPSATPFDELEAVLLEFCLAEGRLSEQHAVLLSKQEQLRRTCDEAATKIHATFTQVRDIVNQQETEMLNKLAEFVKSDNDILDLIAKEVRKTKSFIKTQKCVTEMLKAEDSVAEDVTMFDIREMQDSVELRLNNLEIELQEAIVCPTFRTYDEAIQLLKDTEFGQIVDRHTVTDTTSLSEEQPSSVPCQTESHADVARRESESAVTVDSMDVAATSRLSLTRIDSARSASSPQAPEASRELEEEQQGEEEEHEDEQEEEEPPPPSYWQAIGVPAPSEDPAPEESYSTPPPEEPDSRESYVTLPPEDPAPEESYVTPPLEEPPPPSIENAPRPPARIPSIQTSALIKWHSYPTKKQKERQPSIVSMATCNAYICVVDKFNCKVKFFRDSGKQHVSLLLKGNELYDVACLEDGEVARFVVTIPAAKSLRFVTIDTKSHSVVTKNLVVQHGYTGVARGIAADTLIVTSTSASDDHRVGVEIISATSGAVLLPLNHTPYGVPFQFPRYATTFLDTIIVSDWSLHIVAMFLDNGQPVGQYSGTRDHPLKEPTSVTCDSNGVVFVMDINQDNFHLIDSTCHPLHVLPLRGHVVNPRLLAYHSLSHRLVVASHSGSLHLFDFKVDIGGPSESNDNEAAPDDQSVVAQSAAEEMLPTVIPGMLAKSIHRHN